MSKKLAENLDRLVLDMKFGSGAFMKTRKDAKQLAKAMTEVGTSMGVKILTALPPCLSSGARPILPGKTETHSGIASCGWPRYSLSTLDDSIFSCHLPLAPK